MGVEQLIEAGLVSVVAGLFGSLLGLGGALFITPLLTGPLGVPIHRAVAAGTIAIIATSSAGGSGYLRRDVPNVRLGMVLETGTVLGAIAGALLTNSLHERVIAAIFAAVLLYAGISLLGQPRERAARPDPLATRLGLCARYPVGRLPLGMAAAVGGGLVSGLLGVGGGLILVPAMVTLMGVPLRAATATSTFMIGVTGVAGATIQIGHGQVDPMLAAPVVLGIFLGAVLGPRVAPRLPVSFLRVFLLLVIGLSIVQMAQRAVR